LNNLGTTKVVMKLLWEEDEADLMY